MGISFRLPLPVSLQLGLEPRENPLKVLQLVLWTNAEYYRDPGAADPQHIIKTTKKRANKP